MRHESAVELHVDGLTYFQQLYVCASVRPAYLPALVMIISVPMSWKRFHRSAHCSSTWISSMEAGGDGSQGAGASSSGEPKEHDVLSARPSPSEPGLASESEGKMREMMRRQLSNSGIIRFTQETWHGEKVQWFSPLTPNHLPSGAGPGSARHGVLGLCQKQNKCCVKPLKRDVESIKV